MPEAVLFAEAPVRKKTGSLVTEYPAVMNGLEDDASAGEIPLDSLQGSADRGKGVGDVMEV